MEENLYAAPEVNVVDVVSDAMASDYELASRSARLGARILELLILLPAFGAIIYSMLRVFETLGDGTPEEARAEALAGSFEMALRIGGTYVLIYTVINTIMLVRSGQTVGKKLMKIKIVRYETGERVGAGRMIGFRVLTPWIFGAVKVAYIGIIFRWVNILCIFGEKRQCIHDKIADTVVVNC